MPYADDSLFTLTPVQVGGTGALAAALWAATLLLLWGLRPSNRGVLLAVSLALAALLFWLFAWLSPQAFYQWYRVALGGLPQQWVIGAPPSARDLLAQMTFTGADDLSTHGKGVMGWSLLALALARKGPRPVRG